MQDFNEFLAWEATTRDTIDFKKIYVDMSGDVLAGLVLSEIVYWYLPSKRGEANKLRIQKDNYQWIACARHEWWERTRLTPRQMDRVFDILKKKKLIEKKVYRFDGKPTIHIRINDALFMELWRQQIQNPPANPFLPNGENESLNHQTVKTKSPNGENVLTDSVKTLTETTAKTTTETTKKKDLSPVGEQPLFSTIEARWGVGVGEDWLPAYWDQQGITPKKPVGESDKAINIAIGALIQTYLDTQHIIDKKAYAKIGFREAARELHEAGITPDDLTAFIQHRKTDPFWSDKALAWKHIKDNILGWKATRHARPENPAHREYVPQPKEQCRGGTESVRILREEITRMFTAPPLEDAS